METRTNRPGKSAALKGRRLSGRGVWSSGLAAKLVSSLRKSWSLALASHHGPVKGRAAQLLKHLKLEDVNHQDGKAKIFEVLEWAPASH